MATLNRVIQINWTAVTDVSVTGYNVYLVNGAPANTTKTLLAFVVGRSTILYLYTGLEGAQYQFEVRATDGTNESPPVEIFFPNGTNLFTPTLLTPSGQAMQIARDTQYVTAADFINYPNGLKLSNTSSYYTSGMIDLLLQAASEMVNRMTRRRFDVQTVDEIHQGIRIQQDEPRMMTINLNNAPVQSVSRIDIQVLKYFINFDLQYLQLNPEVGQLQIVPFLGGGAGNIPLPSAVLTAGLLAKVWVRYTFGLDVIPSSIKIATSLLASKLYSLQENPTDAKQVAFGRNFKLEWDSEHEPLMNQVRYLLYPYIINTWRRP